MGGITNVLNGKWFEPGLIDQWFAILCSLGNVMVQCMLELKRSVVDD